MDRRHLSIERAAPPGHLADRRSGIGYGGTGSEATSPASVARAPRKIFCPVASVARRRRSPLLASLFEQARPPHLGDFALAGNRARFYWRVSMSPNFSPRNFLALTSGALAAPSFALPANAEG